MKYFIIAGEPSGDNHGATLIKAIKHLDNNADFSFVGGSNMNEESEGKILDIKELSIMGFGEVILKLPKVIRLAGVIKKSILAFNPDIVIFIDYPGLNLRLAKWAKRNDFKTAYYILPKAWAWNESRVEKIRKYVDLPLSILPFEVPFYKKHDIEIKYVGNPSKEAFKLFIPNPKYLDILSDSKPILAILPGSRLQEINRILPSLMKASLDFGNHQIVVSKAKHISNTVYDKILPVGVSLTEDYFDLLYHCDIALVTSGTATLETALFNKPQIVCYKTSNLNYKLAKRFIKVPYISLVNLIANDEVVLELIQGECNVKSIHKELKRLVNLPHEDRQTLYNTLNNKLGDELCSKNAAQSIIDLVFN